MFHIKQPKGLPLFEGSFTACVKWLLKAQKQRLLNHSHYEIHGRESKREPVKFVCDFFADDLRDDLV